MIGKTSPTTLIGALISVLQAISVDYAKLANGDHGEMAKLGAALLIGALGYFGADRPASAPGDPEEKRETKGIVPGEDPTK